ncbi:hypothetical protein C4552_00190 [Candidatus Parcubacteria bacterium]|nr:MAG: hypothetical protein C4552_00190 [Candidatus Parcubacteria bacterium]
MTPLSRKTVVLLIAVLALAAFFRLWQLPTIPPGLYPDEAANGNNAVEALHTGDFGVFYPENNGREAFFINVQALSIAVFGPDPWALRLVSALVGILTVAAVFFLGRELFRPAVGVPERRWFGIPEHDWIGLAAAFFVATSFWHINFSRIGFRAILVPLLSALGMALLLRSLRTGSIIAAALAGFVLGLGLHTYIAFRFMPFIAAVPAIWALWLWWRGRKAQPCVPCVLALVAFAALIAVAPLILYFAGHPADFTGRGHQVSIFSAERPLQEFVKSNILTLGMLHIWGDCNPRHNFACRPELDPIVGAFFLFGAYFAVRSLWKKPGIQKLPAALLIWWFLVMMLPATLTREGLPHALRAIGMIVPTMLLAAWGFIGLLVAGGTKLDALARRTGISSRFRARLRRLNVELALLALIVVLWVPLVAYRTYFIRFPNAVPTQGAFAADLWNAGKFLDKLPPDIEKFVLVNLSGDPIRGIPAPAQTVMFATNSFEEGPRAERNIHYVTRLEDIRPQNPDNMLILPLNGLEPGIAGRIRERFGHLVGKAPADFSIFIPPSLAAEWYE